MNSGVLQIFHSRAALMNLTETSRHCQTMTEGTTLVYLLVPFTIKSNVSVPPKPIKDTSQTKRGIRHLPSLHKCNFISLRPRIKASLSGIFCVKKVNLGTECTYCWYQILQASWNAKICQAFTMGLNKRAHVIRLQSNSRNWADVNRYYRKHCLFRNIL